MNETSGEFVNRTALILRYKEPALRWIKESDPEGHQLTLEEVNTGRILYLVADDAADTSTKRRSWLKKELPLLLRVRNGEVVKRRYVARRTDP